MTPPEVAVDFKQACNEARAGIGSYAKSVRRLKDVPIPVNTANPDARDAGEIKANIMLAYRHLEDARMRLGKAIQAFDGGVSVYDK